MKLTEKKQKIIKKISVTSTTAALFAIQASQVFAESIGTAEVQAATDNIKRVITSIAMPIPKILTVLFVLILSIFFLLCSFLKINEQNFDKCFFYAVKYLFRKKKFKYRRDST